MALDDLCARTEKASKQAEDKISHSKMQSPVNLLGNLGLPYCKHYQWGESHRSQMAHKCKNENKK